MSIKFIGIHGSYNQLNVALFQDQNCLDSITKTDSRASSNLIPFLDIILKKNNLSLSDLSFIAVDKGPSAFTSLRVTIATINGIAFDNKIPLVGVNGLEAITRQALAFNPNIQNIVTLLNAYNNDAYFLVSKIDMKNLSEHMPKSQSPEAQSGSQSIGCQNIDILLDDLKLKFKEQTIFFCGQGSQLYKSQINHMFADQAVILDEPLLACAKTIGQMGLQCWLKKENIVDQIEPAYLKTQYFAIRK
jgi:tRNA threonylcarbamoyladenosine biosynthesis protein TsaB